MPPSCCTGVKRFQIQPHWSLLPREVALLEQDILPGTWGPCFQTQAPLEFFLKTKCPCKTSWLKEQGSCTPCTATSFSVCAAPSWKLHCTSSLLPTFHF